MVLFFRRCSKSVFQQDNTKLHLSFDQFLSIPVRLTSTDYMQYRIVWVGVLERKQIYFLYMRSPCRRQFYPQFLHHKAKSRSINDQDIFSFFSSWLPFWAPLKTTTIFVVQCNPRYHHLRLLLNSSKRLHMIHAEGSIHIKTSEDDLFLFCDASLRRPKPGWRVTSTFFLILRLYFLRNMVQKIYNTDARKLLLCFIEPSLPLKYYTSVHQLKTSFSESIVGNLLIPFFSSMLPAS